MDFQFFELNGGIDRTHMDFLARLLHNGTARADDLHFPSGKGIGSGHFHIGKASVCTFEDDFEQVIALPDTDHMAHIRPQIHHRRIQQLQCVIDDMRSPVGEQSAIIFRHGHPIVSAAIITAAMEFDILDLADDPGIHQFFHFIEFRFKTAIVTHKKFPGVGIAAIQQFFQFRHIAGDRFFHHSDPSRFQYFDPHRNMIKMPGGDRDHFHITVGKQIIQRTVFFVIIAPCGGQIFQTVRRIIAHGNEFKFISGSGADLIDMTASHSA